MALGIFLGKNIYTPGNFPEFQRKFREREIFSGREFPEIPGCNLYLDVISKVCHLKQYALGLVSQFQNGV